jgi:hypothetical protein
VGREIMRSLRGCFGPRVLCSLQDFVTIEPDPDANGALSRTVRLHVNDVTCAVPLGHRLARDFLLHFQCYLDWRALVQGQVRCKVNALERNIQYLRSLFWRSRPQHLDTERNFDVVSFSKSPFNWGHGDPPPTIRVRTEPN